MNSSILKYNPSLTSDEAIRAQFVARHITLELIIEALRETKHRRANQHILITGPRGAGKTTMLRRITAELRTEEDLVSAFVPVPFPEEAYAVTTAGEFWLQALRRLADERENDELRKSAQDLNTIDDDASLREQALFHLINFSRISGTRLVLLVENLGMLLKQMDRRSAWELRHTFLNESAVVMIGTSLRNIFSGYRQSEEAWFEMFSVYDLGPLDQADTSRLWGSITGTTINPSQLRPIEILTGGNPRLLRIFAEFNKSSSLKLLLNSLVRLIDEHTEYFKTQLDSLPVVERKVFVAVLDAWRPVTTNEIAATSRTSSKQCSSLLNRLVARGAVSTSGNSRRKEYQAAERLFNIYYLLRQGGHPSRRIRAAVQFMTVFYENQDLISSTLQIAREACKLEPLSREDHYLAYDEILRQTALERRFDVVEEILTHTPDEFADLDDLPALIRDHIRKSRPKEGKPSLTEEEARSLLSVAYDLEVTNRQPNEVERAYRAAVEREPNNGHILAHLGSFLSDFPDRLWEAIGLLRSAVEKAPDDDWAWIQYAVVLRDTGKTEDAMAAARKAIEISPKRDLGYDILASIFHNRESYREAEDILLEALTKVGKQSKARIHRGLGELYYRHLDRPDEAKYHLEEALKLTKTHKALVAAELGELILRRFGGAEDARTYFEIAERDFTERIEKEPKDAGAWYLLSDVLSNFPDRTAACEQAVRRAIELAPTRAHYWDSLMDCLAGQQRFDAALEAAQLAVESIPDAKSQRRLGWVYTRMARYSDATVAFEKAMEMDPNYVEAMTGLIGILLRDHTVKSREKVRRLLEQIVQIAGASSSAWPMLLGFMASTDEDSSQIISAAINYIDSRHRLPNALLETAEALITDERADLNSFAESLVKEALPSVKDRKMPSYLLGLIHLIKQAMPDALFYVREFIQDLRGSSEDISKTTELAIRAASLGCAAEILTILRDSSHRENFEALELALLKMMGKQVSAPPELLEVAEDIVDQIKTRRTTDDYGTRSDHGEGGNAKPADEETRRKRRTTTLRSR